MAEPVNICDAKIQPTRLTDRAAAGEDVLVGQTSKARAGKTGSGKTGSGKAGAHRDPFDRRLIAQSRLETMPIVSADPVFAAYGASVVRGAVLAACP